MIPILRVVTLTLLLGWVTGCAATYNTADADLSGAAVLEHLAEEGLNMYATGPVIETVFMTPGEAYLVSGGHPIHIYEYDSESAAVLDVGRVDKGTMNAAVGPHLYQRGPVVVVYYGNNPSITSALSSVLGSSMF